jgi:two-component system, OmpR family, phosphate regulon sensor histidine kinase PhoR
MMSKSIRVLFVEDLEEDVLILLLELRRSGYTPVYRRVDTEQGFLKALVQEERWDVVISDYKMPRFSAPTALKYLKESGLDIPFIVVSGMIQEEVAVAVMKAGAHDYLMKDNLTRLVPAIEREIEEATKRRELKHTESLLLRLGRIIDNASNEIYVFDLGSLCLIQANQSGRQNLDYPDEALKNLKWFDLQPDIDRDEVTEWMSSLSSKKQDLITYETIQRRSNNTTYPVEVRLHLSHTESPPVLVAIVQDISRRKAAERAMRDAYEKEAAARKEAERANALKTQFIGMISHELRTPLAAIKGFSSTLLKTDVSWDTQSQHKFISIIDQEADKLQDLIDQLLDLTQLQAGVLKIKPESVSVESIFEFAQTQLEAVSSGHPFKLDLPGQLPKVMADTRRVAQVLVNLVGNASKFSEVHKPITVSVSSTNDYVEFNIHDEGVGIPVEDRETIFEAFKQAGNRPQKNTSGAGLGLAICKGLVEAHKGRIWIQKEPTSGTTVSFILPTIYSEDKLF